MHAVAGFYITAGSLAGCLQLSVRTGTQVYSYLFDVYTCLICAFIPLQRATGFLPLLLLLQQPCAVG